MTSPEDDVELPTCAELPASGNHASQVLACTSASGAALSCFLVAPIFGDLLYLGDVLITPRGKLVSWSMPAHRWWFERECVV